MKITDNSTSKNVKFANLEVGSVFKFGSLVFMKTHATIDNDLHLLCNALNLNDGESAFFLSDVTVTVVDCELIIK